MALSDDVARLVEATAEAEGFDVVQVKVDPSRRVRVWVDREPGGVTMADCTSLSRRIGAALDEAGHDPGAFHLEVQSPGLDRLLVREKDFVRFQGREVTVKLKEKRGDRAKFQGPLLAYEEGGKVRIAAEGTELVFHPRELLEVRLVPDIPGFAPEPPGGRPKSGRQRKPKRKGKRKPKR